MLLILFVAAGKINHYDSFAYPHIISESKVITLFKKSVNFLAAGTFTTEKEIALPDQDFMQSAALKEYLVDFEDVLCEFKTSSFDAKLCIDKIMNIYFSLYEVYYCTTSGRFDVHTSRELSEVFL